MFTSIVRCGLLAATAVLCATVSQAVSVNDFKGGFDLGTPGKYLLRIGSDPIFLPTEYQDAPVLGSSATFGGWSATLLDLGSRNGGGFAIIDTRNAPHALTISSHGASTPLIGAGGDAVELLFRYGSFPLTTLIQFEIAKLGPIYEIPGVFVVDPGTVLANGSLVESLGKVGLRDNIHQIHPADVNGRFSFQVLTGQSLYLSFLGNGGYAYETYTVGLGPNSIPRLVLLPPSVTTGTVSNFSVSYSPSTVVSVSDSTSTVGLAGAALLLVALFSRARRQVT